mgnify:CR=1 FL=1
MILRSRHSTKKTVHPGRTSRDFIPGYRTPFIASIAISLIFAGLFLHCNGASLTGGTKLEKENEQLKVSEFHLNAFQPIEKQKYSYEELAGLFETMRMASDGYCEFIHNRKPFRKDVARRLISEEYLSRFWRDRYWGSFHNLISGCWNFYIMNDVRPFDDFKLIHSLFPDSAKHCYSVGLMQPYIMHNILHCEDLNFLDVDWRIHYAHFQLESMFRESRFQSVDSTRKAIQDLHLGWIAFSPTPVQDRHQVTPATLCRLNQQECLDHLNQYQESRGKLQGITWNLAALHDADFPSHSGMPVIYLSNAIEELYTSKDQFDELLGKVARSIAPEGKALFAYHAAGTDEIGLYQLTRTEAEGRSDFESGDSDPEKSADTPYPAYIVNTVCRDRYHRANTGQLLEYTTYFEKISTTAAPQGCRPMIKEIKERD